VKEKKLGNWISTQAEKASEKRKPLTPASIKIPITQKNLTINLNRKDEFST
jgi:hypothetical protein